MNIKKIFKQGERLITDNSPVILTAIGTVGAVATALLAGKAAYKARAIIDSEESFTIGDPTSVARDLTAREKFDLTYKLYIPAVSSGVLTVACIVGANRIDSRRAAALAAAWSVSEARFSEYRDKVVDRLGENEHKKVKEELNSDKVQVIPASSFAGVHVGPGEVLMMDAYSMRPFASSVEKMRKVENDLRDKLRSDDYILLAEYYDRIGLEHTVWAQLMGWNTTTGFSMEHEAHLTDIHGVETPVVLWDFSVEAIKDPGSSASF